MQIYLLNSRIYFPKLTGKKCFPLANDLFSCFNWAIKVCCKVREKNQEQRR